MIDHIRISTEIPVLSEVREAIRESFDYCGLVMDPIIKGDRVLKHRGAFGGLVLEIRGDQLMLSNSLTKFVHGNNIQNLNFCDQVEAIETIEDKLNINSLSWKVHSLECGVVLDAIPEEEYESWLSFKGRPKNEMISRAGVVYGSKIQASAFSLKAYSKSKEIKIKERRKIGPNKLRIEKQVQRMQHLHRRKAPIVIDRLSDLKKKENIRNLALDLIDYYSRIDKVPSLLKRNLSTTDLKIAATFSDPYWRGLYRTNGTSTYRKDLTRYNKLWTNEGSMVVDMMKDEVNKLIA